MSSDNQEGCLQLSGNVNHSDEDFIYFEQIYNILSRNDYPQNLDHSSFISLQKKALEYCVSKTLFEEYFKAMQ